MFQREAEAPEEEAEGMHDVDAVSPRAGCFPRARAVTACIVGLLATASGSIGLVGVASAEDCGLTLVAEMPTVDDDDPVVTVLIDDQPRKVLIDTGGFWSLVSPSIIANSPVRPSPVIGMLGLNGIPLTQIVRNQTVQLGPIKFSGIEFFVGPPGYGKWDATLGANWLRAFDVEIDPVEKKVSLFSQKHCVGQVIHWPQSDLAVLPIDIKRREALITIPAHINGSEIEALIDTGAPETVIDVDTAKSMFGVTADSPGAQTFGDKKSFRFQFKSIELDGIAFSNPWLTVAPMRGPGPKMILGMHQLRNLHLYFAYGEKKLYVTTARGDIAKRKAEGGAANIALAHGPDPLDRTNAQDYLEKATVALEKKDIDAASSALNDALRLDPGYAPIYALRAQLYAVKNDDDHAFQDLAEALRLDPKLAAAHTVRARLYITKKDRDHALQDLNEAINLEPTAKFAFEIRGQFYISMGDYEHAFGDFDQLVRLEPRSPVLLNNRCWVGAVLGHLDAAMADCNASLKLAPHAYATLDSRGFVNLKAGRLSDAIDDYDDALERDPKSASSLYGRGLARRQKGDAKRGDADIAAARAIDPDIARHFGK